MEAPKKEFRIAQRDLRSGRYTEAGQPQQRPACIAKQLFGSLVSLVTRNV